MATLTQSDKIQKLNDLADLSNEMLKSTLKTTLDKMVGGLIVKPRSFLKDDLIELIENQTADIRTARKLEIERQQLELETERLALLEQAAKLASIPEATRSGYRDAYGITNAVEQHQVVIKELEIAAKTSTTITDIYSKTGSIVLRYLLEQKQCYAPLTVKSNVTALLVAVRKWSETFPEGAANDNVKTASLIFNKELKIQMTPFYKEQREVEKTTVAERVDSLTAIDPTALLEAAENTLKALSNGAVSSWKDVAISVAIATGRRMAEILSSGKFVAIDDKTILFSGLTKAKSNIEKSLERQIEIPCLIDSYLIVNAVEYLDKTGIRLELVDDVNDKYAKLLSREMGRWVVRYTDGVKVAFKGLRALYATICYNRYGQERDQDKYFSEILGHRENDLTTAGSYKVYKLV